ncbi:MAG: hypothetical protein ACTSX7_14070 [Alphaproteobacteria bacterium]
MTDETNVQAPTESEPAAPVLAPDETGPKAPPSDGEENSTAAVETAEPAVMLDNIGAPIPEGYTDAVFADVAAAYPEEAGALRQSWGEDAAVNTAFARRALEQIEASAPGFVAEMSGQVAVASPKILAALAALGRSLAATPGDPNTVSLDRAMAEAIRNPPVSGAGQDQDLQEKIDGITAQAWEDGAYYSSAAQDKLRPLYQQLHGTTQVSGRQS